MGWVNPCVLDGFDGGRSVWVGSQVSPTAPLPWDGPHSAGTSASRPCRDEGRRNLTKSYDSCQRHRTKGCVGGGSVPEAMARYGGPRTACGLRKR